MVRKTKRGASRKQVRKQRPSFTISWSNVMQYAAGILSVCAVIGVAHYAYQHSDLPIKRVTVGGDFIHVDKKLLEEAVSAYATGNFLSVDVAGLREAGEALPWVKTVQVRRLWPDGLHLVVEEQVAVARWKESYLVNQKGETFLSPQNEIPAGLAVLNGPEDSNEVVVQRYQTMSKILVKQGLIIKQLEMDERRAWTMTLSNDLKVVLGRANSEQRFERFVRVYQDSLQKYESQVLAVDMRYTNGFSVIWKPGKQPNFNGTV